MLYYLFHFVDFFSGFNLFRYLTFRTIGALLSALAIAFFLGKPLIKWLRLKQHDGQPIRSDGPESHLITKKGTPTMGGVLILVSLTISTLLWSNVTNAYILITLFVTLGCGFLGMADDYLKLTRKSSKGVQGKVKLLVQTILTMIAVFWYVQVTPGELITGEAFATGVAIPFTKAYVLPIGSFFYIFSFFVIVGTSNAVNLTDGLDGLAIVPVMIASACFCLIAYLVGNSIFSSYLQLPHVPHTGELAVFCGSLIGAGLGFLWYNAPPAKVFMGDTGSLAAGGALGTVAMITKHELVLIIIGGLFVLEAVSVLLQVVYFKKTGKRIFLMAPMHHHFEKKGWAEPTIIIRFWIIASVLAIIGLSTLKLR